MDIVFVTIVLISEGEWTPRHSSICRDLIKTIWALSVEHWQVQHNQALLNQSWISRNSQTNPEKQGNKATVQLRIYATRQLGKKATTQQGNKASGQLGI